MAAVMPAPEKQGPDKTALGMPDVHIEFYGV